MALPAHDGGSVIKLFALPRYLPRGVLFTSGVLHSHSLPCFLPACVVRFDRIPNYLPGFMVACLKSPTGTIAICLFLRGTSCYIFFFKKKDEWF